MRRRLSPPQAQAKSACEHNGAAKVRFRDISGVGGSQCGVQAAVGLSGGLGGAGAPRAPLLVDELVDQDRFLALPPLRTFAASAFCQSSSQNVALRNRRVALSSNMAIMWQTEGEGGYRAGWARVTHRTRRDAGPSQVRVSRPTKAGERHLHALGPAAAGTRLSTAATTLVTRQTGPRGRLPPGWQAAPHLVKAWSTCQQKVFFRNGACLLLVRFH